MQLPDKRLIVTVGTKTWLSNRYSVSIRTVNSWLAKESDIHDMEDFLALVIRWDSSIRGECVPRPIVFLEDTM